ncbi:MAG: ABC transporter substrate-binding protein [Candidatus Dojkabacteria bacterium]
MNRKVLLIGIGVLGVILLLVIGLWIYTKLKANNTNNNNNNTNTNGSLTKDNITLEYWGLWEPSSVMDSAIAKFTTKYPNIKVKYTQKSFTQYDENSFTRLKEGSTDGSPTPDILRIHNTWLSKYQPYLNPAPASVMTPTQYKSAFYPTAANDFIGTDNQIYAIPLEVDGLALFYNKELLQTVGETEPPTSWDDVIDLAKRLTKTDASGNITQAGLAMGSSNNVKHAADILSLLMLQNGVDVIDDTNKVMNVADELSVTSLEFYTDFVTEHKTWSPDLRSDLEMFYTGKLAMMIAPSWAVFDVLNSNSTIEFGLAPTPIIGGEEVYYGHYWGDTVSKNCKYPLEAWTFIKFLSEEAQLKELYANSSQIRAFGEPYSRVAMNSQLANEPYVGAIMTMAPKFQAWKKGEEAFVNKEFNTAINQVINGGLDSVTALSQAETNINQKLATSIL